MSKVRPLDHLEVRTDLSPVPLFYLIESALLGDVESYDSVRRITWIRQPHMEPKTGWSLVMKSQ
jgi:hypothetical protein